MTAEDHFILIFVSYLVKFLPIQNGFNQMIGRLVCRSTYTAMQCLLHWVMHTIAGYMQMIPSK